MSDQRARRRKVGETVQGLVLEVGFGTSAARLPAELHLHSKRLFV